MIADPVLTALRSKPERRADLTRSIIAGQAKATDRIEPDSLSAEERALVAEHRARARDAAT